VRERLLTLALAVAAFALFYTLFAPQKRPTEPMTRPVTTEAGPNGYLALQRWLASQGITPVPLRQRYTQLATLHADESRDGNLLISTAPFLLPMRSSEEQSLEQWIADGNTLLVLAGLADTPEWSMGAGYDPLLREHLQAMTGMRFVDASIASAQSSAAKAANDSIDSPDRGVGEAHPVDPQPSNDPAKKPNRVRQVAVSSVGRLPTPARHELVPNGKHPLLQDVHAVVALSEYPSEQFRASPSAVDVVLELARDRVADEPVLWLAQRGRGQIIVCGFGSVFTNKLLAQADNARLLANIVARSLRGSGRVIIDDAHQGAVDFYDPAAFYKDSRLHGSLLWLIALWLVFVLGPQRLRATAPSWHPVDITTFVRATGGFLARVVKPAAAAQQLFDNFFDDIGRLAGATPAWEWLQSHSTVSTRDLAQLRELHDRTARGHRVDLPGLHNLLTRIRRAMT
jgi:hypothetical protein